MVVKSGDIEVRNETIEIKTGDTDIKNDIE